MERILARNDWFELNDSMGFAYAISQWGYFDERPQLRIYITSVVALLVMVPMGIALGLPWYYWVATAVLFLFGKYQLFVSLPFRTGNVQCESPQWGVYYFENALWFPWGEEIHRVGMPWDWVHIRRSIMLKDGTWEHSYKGDSKSFWEEHWLEKRWTSRLPYTNTRSNGEEQTVMCTVTVGEQEWRWKLFQWLPWGPFQKVNRSIWVEFDDEIGEGVGSYKGGTVGAGHKMKEGEMAWETLDRMMEERQL